jgi:integrase
MNDNHCDRVERPHIENGTPTILTIDEAKKALKFAHAEKKDFLPWLTLALFAGVRPEECDKLDWDHIDLKEGIVRIDAAIAKVRNRRIVHLKPVAIQWLKLGGKLPLKQVSRRRYIRKLRDALGWEVWKKDSLRHSTGSYWMASDQNAPMVASELGTSVKVLMKNYRDGDVSDANAEEFWNLTPRRVLK